MRIEQTFRSQEVVLYVPPPKTPEDSRIGNPEPERVLKVVPATVYVEYDKRGIAHEYRFGGSSWVC